VSLGAMMPTCVPSPWIRLPIENSGVPSKEPGTLAIKEVYGFVLTENMHKKRRTVVATNWQSFKALLPFARYNLGTCWLRDLRPIKPLTKGKKKS
jgi:hypothetical protein